MEFLIANLKWIATSIISILSPLFAFHIYQSREAKERHIRQGEHQEFEKNVIEKLAEHGKLIERMQIYISEKVPEYKDAINSKFDLLVQDEGKCRLDLTQRIAGVEIRHGELEKRVNGLEYKCAEFRRKHNLTRKQEVKIAKDNLKRADKFLNKYPK